MNHAPHSFLALGLTLAVVMTLSVGCCGPMWQPGCGIGHGSVCGDGCGSHGGCGELYIDPWINEPADCYDPCDSCGNFNGQSCGTCRSVFAGVKSLWGYRYADHHGGCDSACDSGIGIAGGDCGCGHGEHGGGVIQHGEVYEQYSGGGDPGYQLGPGETLVDPRLSTNAKAMSGAGTKVRSSTPARVVSQQRRVPRPGDARQIFHPRRVNESRPLAY